MPSSISSTSGNLIDQQVDAIVIDWKPNLFSLRGLFQSVHTRQIRCLCGREVTRELAKQWPPLNKAAHTTAGQLPFRGIIHVDSSSFFVFLSTENSIRSAVRYALDIAKEKKYRSIAFPLLNEGIRLASQVKTWEIMVDECRRSSFTGDVTILLNNKTAPLATAIPNEKKRNKSLSIEYRKGILFFFPRGNSITQFSDVIQLPDSASDEAKAEAFMKAFDLAGKKMEWGIPMPEMEVFLASLKLKTWASYCKCVLHSSVYWNKKDKTFTFSSLKYDHGGFSAEKGDPEVVISDEASPKEITQAIEQCLNSCVGQGGKKKSDYEKESKSSEEPICYGVNFGYKTCWLAIKSQEPMKIAEKLGIVNPRSVDWQTGIDKAYQNSVFITPPVGEWILVAGTGVDDSELMSLSKEFGEAQSFGTHRGSGIHAWAKAVDGQIVRSFESSDNGVAESGKPTPIERKLIDFSDEDSVMSVNEETVMQVAAEWSINPMDLESLEGIAKSGLLG